MSDAFALVEADVEAAQEFSEIYQQCFATQWSESDFARFLTDKHVVAFKVQNNQQICGFVLSRYVVDEAEILAIAVLPRFRRAGLATKLLRKLFDFCEKQDVTQVFLEVAEHNSAAIGLYKGLGFEAFGRREGYYRGGDEGTSHACLNLRLSIGERG